MRARVSKILAKVAVKFNLNLADLKREYKRLPWNRRQAVLEQTKKSIELGNWKKVLEQLQIKEAA